MCLSSVEDVQSQPSMRFGSVIMGRPTSRWIEPGIQADSGLVVACSGWVGVGAANRPGRSARGCSAHYSAVGRPQTSVPPAQCRRRYSTSRSLAPTFGAEARLWTCDDEKGGAWPPVTSRCTNPEGMLCLKGEIDKLVAGALGVDS